MSLLEIQVSDRFATLYRRGYATLQERIERATVEFARRFRSDPAACLHNYDRCATVPGVVEVDLDRSRRMLVHVFNGRLLLLNAGEHDIVSRYTSRMFAADCASAHPAKGALALHKPSRFFSCSPASVPTRFANETEPEWLYFLDEEQDRVCSEVFDQIETTLLSERDRSTTYIVGGPGTGKTSLLLVLLKRCIDELKICAQIQLSDEVTEYLVASTSCDMVQHRFQDSSDTAQPRPDVLFVDDPLLLQSWEGLELPRPRVVVLGFDPLQLGESLTDRDFEERKTSDRATVHNLKTCYRQKENVGAATKRAVDRIAESTPFLVPQKIQDHRTERERLTDLANSLQFRNPGGYVQTYPTWTQQQFTQEFERITARRELLWRHWPPILIVVEGRPDPSWERFRVKLGRSLGREPDSLVRVVELDSLEQIKGLEFQHVFLMISQTLFDALENGFTGSGRSVYRKRRLLRIPFSRAKDSLVTFVIEL